MQKWVEQANALLEDLSKQNLPFGFSLEENYVCKPSGNDALENLLSTYQLSSSVRDFYLSCGGLAWNNVQNGYWVDSLESLAARRQSGDVITITGAFAGEVIVCGTTGSGGRFALRMGGYDEVLYLPSGARVDGTVLDGTNAFYAPEIVAKDFGDFAKLLLLDLEAFAHGDSSWTYISSH